MALIPCPECGRSVSSFANTCPNCGYPVRLIHGEIINQRDNKTQNTHCGYHADDIPEQEPDYIADCFDGDWQMFEDNYSD